jgi:Rrf2 family iron-sulfur cluster assembly transcriptional regulator
MGRGARDVKVSAQEEYGLRCLLQLAYLGQGESLTLNEIAKREGITAANAGKLLWILSKAGLVHSTRGTKGGYTLARPAADIHLNEVIKVLDENQVENHCQSYTGIKDVCVHSVSCGIRPVIVGLHEVVHEALSRITLQQLVGSEAKVDQTLYHLHGTHSSNSVENGI